MKIVDLGGEREKRRDTCPYCGGDEHEQPLMCDRVSAIEINEDTGRIYRVEFFEKFFEASDGDEENPDDAA